MIGSVTVSGIRRLKHLSVRGEVEEYSMSFLMTKVNYILKPTASATLCYWLKW